MLNIEKESCFCFTSDIDWASEHAISVTFEMFQDFGVPLTFFITHESRLIRRYFQDQKVEIGIHPNFLEGSSQGTYATEIIEYLEGLYPESRCFRNHRYYDLNDINDLMYQKGYRYDSNLCTDLEIVRPFFHRSGLLRIPIFMEDGGYLLKRHPLDFGSRSRAFEANGLKVINVHPMHMALNSPDFGYARNLKDKLTRKEWNQLSRKDIEKLSYKGLGIRTFIGSLLEQIREQNSALLTLSQVYEMCKSASPNS
jgi:hypothetical protein